jgi:hypothetical protein
LQAQVIGLKSVQGHYIEFGILITHKERQKINNRTHISTTKIEEKKNE